MCVDLWHDDRISIQTRNFLVAILLSTVSHVFALALIDQVVTPAPASAPLRVVIITTSPPAKVVPVVPAVPDHQVSVVPDHAADPLPIAAKKSARHVPRPAPHKQVTPAHTARKMPPAAHDSLTVATSPESASIPVAVSATTPPPVSREVEYLYNPPPDYPPRARRLGMEGEVLVRARVLLNGECDELELAKSSGYALLDQAAMEAIRKWRFRPARRGDEQIISRVDIPVRFHLER